MVEVRRREGQSEMPGTGPMPVLRVAGGQSDSSDEITLEDVDPVGRTEVMIYGPPGSGKTVLAGTFPPPFRWMDTDKGTKSLKWALKAGKLSTRDPKDVVIFRPSETLDGQYPSRGRGIIPAFDQMSDKQDFWFSSGEVDKWQTIVVDSFTEVNEWALNKGLYLNVTLPTKEKPLSTSERVNATAKVRLVTGQQDYKSAMGLCEGYITDLRIECEKHGKNLVVICHEYTEEREKDDGTMETVRYMPLLIGQLRQRMAKSFDDIWYTEMSRGAAGNEVTVLVHEDARHIAKTRWGDILKRTEPADYRQLIAKVRQYHNG